MILKCLKLLTDHKVVIIYEENLEKLMGENDTNYQPQEEANEFIDKTLFGGQKISS